MMNKPIYLMDSNTLITAANEYYHFHLVRSFWHQLAKLIQDGTIIILDKVYDEVTTEDQANVPKKKEELDEWMLTHIKPYVHSSRTPEYMMAYGELAKSIHANAVYNMKAWHSWFDKESIADPWLIAVAKSNDYVLVSLEKGHEIAKGQVYAKIKLPNIALQQGITYASTFEMMHALGLTLG
jgi:Domain of unknown function (DUF4411)